MKKYITHKNRLCGHCGVVHYNTTNNFCRGCRKHWVFDFGEYRGKGIDWVNLVDRDYLVDWTTSTISHLLPKRMLENIVKIVNVIRIIPHTTYLSIKID